MARLELKPIDALVTQLDKMGKIDDVAPKMISGGLNIMADEQKKQLSAHRQTGGLVRSIKAGKVTKKKKGGFSGRVVADGYEANSKKTKAYPRGKPHDVKWVALEFGTSDQAATPTVQKTINASQDEAVERMQQIYELETMTR